ncbi:MAG: DUF2807 domain-containing protein [Muribaculaceae bacterium]|nr:DUF2807 domain-containing protein [Muribaculaceae bacterium]
MKNFKIYILACLVFIGYMAGYAETYTVEVGQFEKLKVNGNFKLVYKNLPDSTGMARYIAPEGNEGLYLFTSKGDGSLKVEPSDDKWGNLDLPIVYVYSDFLSSIESYSDQNVEVLNLVPCASFNINQVGNGTISVDNVKSNNVSASITTGNGSIFVSGTCVNAKFRMVGAGLISADRLKAENVKCRILGTGSIGCWAVDDLKVTGLGTTKIYYKGDPTVKKTGGGKLFDLPEELDETSYSKLGTPIETFTPSDNSSNDDEEEYDSDDEDDDYQTIVTADD